jgi:hypothetical protein
VRLDLKTQKLWSRCLDAAEAYWNFRVYAPGGHPVGMARLRRTVQRMKRRYGDGVGDAFADLLTSHFGSYASQDMAKWIFHNATIHDAKGQDYARLADPAVYQWVKVELALAKNLLLHRSMQAESWDVGDEVYDKAAEAILELEYKVNPPQWAGPSRGEEFLDNVERWYGWDVKSELGFLMSTRSVVNISHQLRWLCRQGNEAARKLCDPRMLGRLKVTAATTMAASKAKKVIEARISPIDPRIYKLVGICHKIGMSNSPRRRDVLLQVDQKFGPEVADYFHSYANAAHSGRWLTADFEMRLGDPKSAFSRLTDRDIAWLQLKAAMLHEGVQPDPVKRACRHAANEIDSIIQDNLWELSTVRTHFIDRLREELTKKYGRPLALEFVKVFTRRVIQWNPIGESGLYYGIYVDCDRATQQVITSPEFLRWLKVTMAKVRLSMAMRSQLPRLPESEVSDWHRSVTFAAQVLDAIFSREWTRVVRQVFGGLTMTQDDEALADANHLYHQRFMELRPKIAARFGDAVADELYGLSRDFGQHSLTPWLASRTVENKVICSPKFLAWLKVQVAMSAAVGESAQAVIDSAAERERLVKASKLMNSIGIQFHRDGEFRYPMGGSLPTEFGLTSALFLGTIDQRFGPGVKDITLALLNKTTPFSYGLSAQGIERALDLWQGDPNVVRFMQPDVQHWIEQWFAKYKVSKAMKLGVKAKGPS